MTISGLREEKKQQTREALVQSAYRLFAKRGYSRTSIEDIAREARFAPRTFFLHFASKEDLLFPDAEQLRTSLETVFRDRSGDVSALQTLKQWILAVAARKESRELEAMRLRKRIIASEKILQGREKLYLGIIETTLAREIAKDIRAKADAIEPKIIASAAVAVFAAIDAYLDQDLSKQEAAKLIDEGIAFLEGGTRSLVG